MKIIFVFLYHIFLRGGMEMDLREALGILMLSPVYFRFTPEERRGLAEEYCQTVDGVDGEVPVNSKINNDNFDD